MKVEQRDIVLVPFSDQTGQKVRPVIVVSNNQFNMSSQDIIVCAITTNIIKNIYTIKIEKHQLEGGNITEECCIKIENILKIDKKLVIKKIDKFREREFDEVRKKLNELF